MKSNEGEKEFENLCNRIGLQAKKIPETPTKKTPDYIVYDSGSVKFYAEVKSLSDSEKEELKEFKNLAQNGGVAVMDCNFSEKPAYLKRFLNQAAKQLKEGICERLPTLLVIYAEDIFRLCCESNMEASLRKGFINIPEEISAVMILKNKGEVSNDRFLLFRNDKAIVDFPPIFD